MHNVFKGIVIGAIGYFIWMAASFYTGITEALVGPNPRGMIFVYLGFFIMVGGPIVYIIILPVVGWLRRRRSQ